MSPNPRPARRTRIALACVSAVALAVPLTLVAPTAAATGSTRQEQVAGHRIKTGSRAAVRKAWKASWRPAARARIRFAHGSAATCKPYRATKKTQKKARAALNFARRMAGLGVIRTFTDSRLGGAEKSALIQAANNTLTHDPSPSMKCYTRAGDRAAGRSDLGYYATTSSAAPSVARFVANFLTDPGSSNKQAGHRRWVLRAKTTTMANGYARARHGSYHVWTNDLAVFPTGRDNPHAKKPKFIPWPTAGYFPTQLEPRGRWSLSTARSGISLKHARIRVTHNGKRVTVTRRPPQSFYPGDRTIVWQLAKHPRKIRGSGTAVYKVRVTHIKGAKNYTYKVRLFKP